MVKIMMRDGKIVMRPNATIQGIGDFDDPCNAPCECCFIDCLPGIKSPLAWDLDPGNWSESTGTGDECQAACCAVFEKPAVLMHWSRAYTAISVSTEPGSAYDPVDSLRTVSCGGRGCEYFAVFGEGNSYTGHGSVRAIDPESQQCDVPRQEEDAEFYNIWAVEEIIRRETLTVRHTTETVGTGENEETICDCFDTDVPYEIGGFFFTGSEVNLLNASKWSLFITQPDVPEPTQINIRLRAAYQGALTVVNLVDYIATLPLPGPASDLTSIESITLELDPLSFDTFDPPCNFPDAVTLTPIKPEEIKARNLLGGTDGCCCYRACELLNSEHGILSMLLDIGGESARVCLGGTAAPTRIGTWSGTLFAVNHQFEGVCAGVNFTFLIYCKQTLATGENQWTLQIFDGTNISELPIEWDAPPLVQGDATGLVDVCQAGTGSGSVGVVFGAFITDFTGAPPDHPLTGCCTNLAAFCPEPFDLCARGTSSNQFCSPDDCTQLTITGDPLPGGASPTGFDSSKQYWYGFFPFPDSLEAFSQWHVVVYCDGSDIRYAIIDNFDTIRQEGVLGGGCSPGGEVDVTNLIVVTSCFMSNDTATMTIGNCPCP